MDRRNFIKAAAATAVVPVLVPSSVFARPAPSDTLQFGCIGVGRQGQADMQELIYRGLEAGARVTAVCDADAHRLQDAQWLAEKIYTLETGKEAAGSVAAYRDFRELLARKDLDGVLIVTPDFWHAAHAVAAAEAGKDIYLEKPLTYSIAEGKALVAAVRRHKRVLQVGSQQRSSIHFLMACELARNGRVGKLHTVRAWLPEDQGAGDARPTPVPPNLDYDAWMGPTAPAPFAEDRVHPQTSYERPGWLQIEPYCLGMITGWGSHMIDIAQWGHGSELTGPVSVEAAAEFPGRGLFDVHTKFKAEAVYADGVRLIMETGDPAGVRFEGDQGWVFVQRGAIKASDPEILKWKPGQGDVKLEQSGNHMKNFLEAVRARRDPIAPVEVGHRSNSICVMTHIAMKLGRKLAWDPITETFTGDDEANRRLDYPHRAPWKV
ncbi:MAG: Gfo/Idh/MocA family oxidoreductase [Acidobacteria bacterium]|nr:Gfo/Idh/MocA family oxidoreductase [Acidobacteriota bacterium]